VFIHYDDARCADMGRSKSFRTDMTHYQQLSTRYSHQMKGEVHKHFRNVSCDSLSSETGTTLDK
jgi:hypothetical protein